MSVAKNMVAALIQKLGLPAPLFDNNVCVIQFDAHLLNFHVDDERDELRCFVRVTDVPADREARLNLYRKLLQANAFGRRTAGGQLGIDENETFVVFSLVFPVANLAVDDLKVIVQNLLNLTEDFQRELGQAEDAAPASIASPSPAGFGLRV
ncbi:MAG: type III secretion system chaperone [Planctomycetes bacterium]|nr:type III secretion system chaperone [Planctomycetota bacterium]